MFLVCCIELKSCWKESKINFAETEVRQTSKVNNFSTFHTIGTLGMIYKTFQSTQFFKLLVLIFRSWKIDWKYWNFS